MRRVEDQLRDFARYADERLPWVDPLDIASHAAVDEVAGDETQRSNEVASVGLDTKRRGRRGALALIAAAVAVIGVSIALLLNAGGDRQSVEVVPAGTAPLQTVTTAAPDTVSGRTETTATRPTASPTGGPVEVEGDGPILEFTPVPAPDETLSFEHRGFTSPTNTFAGQVYVMGASDGGLAVEGSAYRSANGLDWDPVDGFNAIDAPKGETFAASDDMIVNVALTFDLSESHIGDPRTPCVENAVLHVHTSLDGDTWVSSRIDDVVPATWSEFCVNVGQLQLAVGPGGAFVMVSPHVFLLETTLIADALGLDAFIEVEAGPEGHGSPIRIVTTQEGETFEVSLDDPRFSGMRSRYDQVLAETDPNGQGSLAWLSSDGVAWMPVARSGPMLGYSFGPTAAADGIYLNGVGEFWRTRDGTSWDQIDQSEFPIMGAGASVAGDFGSFTLEPEPLVVTLSDGETWARWTPPELPRDPEGGSSLEYLGMGTDFVVLVERAVEPSSDDDGERATARFWIGRLP